MPQPVNRNQVTNPWTGAAGIPALHHAPIDIEARRRVVWCFNDFLSSGDYAGAGAPWTETDIAVSGGSITLSALQFGTLVIDAGVTTQRGFQTQLTGTPVSQNAGLVFNNTQIGPSGNGVNQAWGFGARFQVNTASAGHVFLGMSATDTSLQAPATGLPAPAGGASMFAFFSTATALGCFSNRNLSVSTTSTGLYTLVDATYIDVAFRATQLSTFASGGTAVDTTDGYMEFFINAGTGWKLVATHNGYIGASSTIRPSFGAINGAGAIDLTVDYFWEWYTRATP